MNKSTLNFAPEAVSLGGARRRLVLTLTCMGLAACAPLSERATPPPKTGATVGMLIRLSELEIEAPFLEQYLAILREESEASVRLEPGVISIYPMYQEAAPTQIRILEIYASREAYEAHLQTPHFKQYKSATQGMVKALKLVDMKAVDPKTMPQLFTKMATAIK